jgi:ankyrin repeat protein
MIKKKFGITNPKNKSGRTPLHEAATNGHTEICHYILEFENEKNPEDKDGWTPYNLAAEEGHDVICQMMTSFLGFTPSRRRPKLKKD